MRGIPCKGGWGGRGKCQGHEGDIGLAWGVERAASERTSQVEFPPISRQEEAPSPLFLHGHCVRPIFTDRRHSTHLAGACTCCLVKSLILAPVLLSFEPFLVPFLWPLLDACNNPRSTPGFTSQGWPGSSRAKICGFLCVHLMARSGWTGRTHAPQ